MPGQRGSLAGVAEHVGKEAEEPSRAADQPGHEPDTEGVLVGDLLRYGELERVLTAYKNAVNRAKTIANATSGDTGRQYGGLCGGLSIRRSASMTATARRRAPA